MPRLKKVDFSGYVMRERTSLRRDIVRFVLWARNKHPNIHIQPNEVCQRATMLARRPSPNSHEVQAVMGALPDVRRILLAEYKCTLVTKPGLGIRATTGDADVLMNRMPRVRAALLGAQASFVATAGLIDINKVPNLPEYIVNKDWYKSSVMPIVKAITTTDFASKLLPPKKPNGSNGAGSK